MEDFIPLGTEDRAILELECRTIAGHTCKVVRLGASERGAFDAERLRERVAERIELAPALTRRLGGSAQAPGWVPDLSFDIADHVVAADVDAPLDRAALLALVAELFEQRLDRSRPLWRIDVVAMRDGGSALIWRIHHALADGTASVRYARALLWDDGVQASMTPAQAHAEHATDEARRRAHLAGFLHREYSRGACRSPFDGTVGTRREIAFAVAPLRALHDAARELDGATVNDAVLTIVAGAVGRWLRQRHGELGTIRMRVPVSMHHEGDQVANHDSFFSVAVPLNELDPVARLRITHAETRERKLDHDAQYHEQLVRELSGLPPFEHFVARIERNPRRFALSVSNVPGPPRPVSVLGAPVVHLHSIAEIGERHALRVSATSLAGLLCFALCSDPDLVDELQLMAAGIESEARELLSAAGIADQAHIGYEATH
ncbi:MAG TPA: wax ester/triacylglycerol synthase domain-containing protein [Solirubrobacteraceae bacterium]|jgi:WS/DGAT/MGAT family acyltransferase|nr:wax ester/triacylglycerol synthase domain-containing protein [Solirubrobacteraceae bacterium]